MYVPKLCQEVTRYNLLLIKINVIFVVLRFKYLWYVYSVHKDVWLMNDNKQQMRRSGNSEETKRILMDLDVVVRSHDCPYIVRCLGCFVTDADVWICMELMASCFDKLLKRLGAPIPETILGKVTVAVSFGLYIYMNIFSSCMYIYRVCQGTII